MQYTVLIPLFIFIGAMVLFGFSFQKKQQQRRIVQILFLAYCVDFLALIIAVMMLTFLSYDDLMLGVLIPVLILSIIMFFVMIIAHYPLMKRLFGH